MRKLCRYRSPCLSLQPPEEPEDWITTIILSKQQKENLGVKASMKIIWQYVPEIVETQPQQTEIAISTCITKTTTLQYPPRFTIDGVNPNISRGITSPRKFQSKEKGVLQKASY